MITTPPARALAGLRVVVTRARRQAGDLAGRLEALGAEVIELPVIEIQPLPPAGLDAGLRQLASFDWLVLTSTNGVDVLLDRARALEITIDRSCGLKVAAIGEATAGRLTAAGVPVHLVPPRAIAESLLEALVAQGVAGRQVLLPVAEGARQVLPEGLRAAGAMVEVIDTYRTVRPAGAAAETVGAIREGSVDMMTIASPSAARNLAEIVGLPLAKSIIVASIGPITSQAARELGLRVDVEAADHSIAGLVDAVVACAAGRATE